MNEITKLKNLYEEELFSYVIPFWTKYSQDKIYGGFFNNLDISGEIYDTQKHVWLQAREVWMFSKLYEYEQNPVYLKMAKTGIDFITKYAKRNDGRVYFSLTQEGKPIYLQRKIFSECFYIIALSKYSQITGNNDLLNDAKNLFEKVLKWSENLSILGKPSFSGQAQTLAVPMILLNVIEELSTINYISVVKKCIEKIKLHIINDTVYENVNIDGSMIDGPDGRLLNPGHAIEAGWFLQHWAKILKDNELKQLAINIVRWSFDKGWDKKNKGIYYFLDSKGYSPTQLEWSMKLWWPHCESMYANLLNYSLTNASEDWERFKKTHDYAFSHFSDRKNGEWFGYLDERGEITHRFKGGPYKGCFHVPRALFYCYKLLSSLQGVR